MQKSDRRRLVEALEFALDAHGDQQRKGVGIPYASHLLAVAGLVFEAGGDTTQAVAGLLHDTLEDCDEVDAVALRTRFGDEVAKIVAACSDVLPGDASDAKSEWGVRKRRYLEQIESAGPEVRRVAACDKLHNLRCLIGDLRASGPETLERFTASAERTRWYYESAHRILRDALPDPLLGEFDALIDALRGFIPRSEAPGAD